MLSSNGACQITMTIAIDCLPVLRVNPAPIRILFGLRQLVSRLDSSRLPIGFIDSISTGTSRGLIIDITGAVRSVFH
jgi:hypothetical protein